MYIIKKKRVTFILIAVLLGIFVYSYEEAKIIQSNLNESIQKENKRIAMKLDTVYIMKHV